MPRVKIKLLPLLSIMAGIEEVEIRIEEGLSLMGLLERLSERYGQRFRKFLFDIGTGELWRNVRITVNEVFIELDQIKRTELKDGDIISIAPPRSI
ncbi:MAG: hypothetical protein GTO54_02000 [Nitrososphaeria archaeon]|nr:hypothetical protein [Nitrososphaeria archaeon]